MRLFSKKKSKSTYLRISHASFFNPRPLFSTSYSYRFNMLRLQFPQAPPTILYQPLILVQYAPPTISTSPSHYFLGATPTGSICPAYNFYKPHQHALAYQRYVSRVSLHPPQERPHFARQTSIQAPPTNFPARVMHLDTPGTWVDMVPAAAPSLLTTLPIFHGEISTQYNVHCTVYTVPCMV